MKLSEQWLREWVDITLSREKLIEILSLAGLAVESCEPYEDDFILEFELTPNRGDCLSVLGIAREISAVTGNKVINNNIKKINNTIKNKIKLNIKNNNPACLYYVGRNININKNNSNIANNRLFKNIQKNLVKSGFKLINPIVDVMNYVMVELGQPLHAFDANKITGNRICVRQAEDKEKIILLDGKALELNNNVLVIADEEKLLAMAGIMGSLDSSVTDKTECVFIESAFFTPDSIAGRARAYNLHTEASHRFERGVDPELPVRALERATELLASIFPDIEISDRVEYKSNSPVIKKPIKIRTERANKILGANLTDDDIKVLLQKLNMDVIHHQVLAPSYRFDITEEIDLIEEIGRLYGYDKLSSDNKLYLNTVNHLPENTVPLYNIKQILINLGYQEIISYSFISQEWQDKVSGNIKSHHLINPLSAELAVMRASLWGSLLKAVHYNMNRQQDEMRFFETGCRFYDDKQEPVLSGIWAGLAYPEQWGEKKRGVDFFDVKNTLELLNPAFTYKPGQHVALHPGQTAEIFLHNQSVGFCGALHPELHKSVDMDFSVFLFEIRLDALDNKKIPYFKSVTKFPSIRRDIALMLDKANQEMTLDKIKNVIQDAAGELLNNIIVFDVYQKTNIALGLIFQSPDRTLVEVEVNDLMEKIVSALKQECMILLRE